MKVLGLSQSKNEDQSLQQVYFGKGRKEEMAVEEDAMTMLAMQMVKVVSGRSFSEYAPELDTLFEQAAALTEAENSHPFVFWDYAIFLNRDEQYEKSTGYANWYQNRIPAFLSSNELLEEQQFQVEMLKAANQLQMRFTSAFQAEYSMRKCEKAITEWIQVDVQHLDTEDILAWYSDLMKRVKKLELCLDFVPRYAVWLSQIGKTEFAMEWLLWARKTIQSDANSSYADVLPIVERTMITIHQG